MRPSFGGIALTAWLAAGAAAAGAQETDDAPAMQPGAPDEDPLDTVTIVRALDKVTARLTTLRLPEDEPVSFGTLEITARHCYSRPPEEPPETFAFLLIDDMQDEESERVFSGWMIASSPALHALEHPVYDVWVIACERLEGGES